MRLLIDIPAEMESEKLTVAMDTKFNLANFLSEKGFGLARVKVLPDETNGELLDKFNGDACYKQGLNDAWKCAKKIWNMRADEVIAVFGGCSMWVNYPASEAMKMIKEYEENKQ